MGTGWALNSPRNTCRRVNELQGGVMQEASHQLILCSSLWPQPVPTGKPGGTGPPGSHVVDRHMGCPWLYFRVLATVLSCQAAHSPFFSSPLSLQLVSVGIRKQSTLKGQVCLPSLQWYPQKREKAGRDFIVLVTVGFVSLAGKAIWRLKNNLFCLNGCAILDS